MPSSKPTAASLASQLLDAQVRHHLDRLAGAHLESTVRGLADDLMAVGGQHQLADLVDEQVIAEVVVRALATVPASAAVSGFVDLGLQVAMDGPTEPHTVGDVFDRDQVEAALDAALGLTPVLERALERLTASPLVGTMASRFMGRIVGEVLQANKAVADKVPGLGSLMSFGTNAASKVMGAADKQFEGLIGDTMGRGGTFAVRRLNRIIVETLRDPTTREALLQVWDMVGAEPVNGVGEHASREEVASLVDALHEMAITTLADEHVAALATVVVKGFFERFGGYTPTELLGELDLDREDVVDDLVRIAPGVIDALRESGDLERIIRAQLEPFYSSVEVTRLLE
ncbi:hypothetical protein ncot_11210 [Nocardioides sp. JQ2195]|uniref:hypothetical protein n=1 Tax=Nocardioides sp. JQ2195 TaxID=2592334 RepID=UPI00143E54BB|nr:hypothetical protein [Nocardioides sp. JQ2195]QIX27099.1 hypothetical protein ncot_11210 [Nocardioides sp. JQ2195]